MSAIAEVEVLPPDVDTKVVAIRRLDSPEMQARAVTVMLSHARTGLLAAIAAQDLPQIVQFRAKASAIAEIAKQVRLGKDMQLDATEFVRRAERGLGVAIREGQARGEVATASESMSRGAIERDLRLGRSTKTREDLVHKPAPSEFATKTELNGVVSATSGTDRPGIYAMTDNVSDAQFEEAVTEAREEGNLSRANVARKCKAKSKPVVDSADPMIDAQVAEPGPTPPKKRLTKHDSTEMLANINGMLNGIVESLPFIDPAEVDAEASKPVVHNIRHSLGVIRRLLKEIDNG